MDQQTRVRTRELAARDAERRFAAQRAAAAPSTTDPPAAAPSTIELPVAEPAVGEEVAAGESPASARLRALIDARYRRPRAQYFWMNGATARDTVPDEDFVVNDLASEPIPATWGAPAAPGGPLFLVRMMTRQFDDGLGGL